MNILVVGPQASGKGTQSKLLSERLGFAYFETGDILRQKAKEKTPLGEKIDRTINQKGELVSDEIILQILKSWLSRANLKKGVIFDGFPRNKDQYWLLEKLLQSFKAKLDMAILLKISRETSVKRLLSRRVCSQCDREYNLMTRPPKSKGLCDECGAGLVRRKDDSRELIEKRYSWHVLGGLFLSLVEQVATGSPPLQDQSAS